MLTCECGGTFKKIEGLEGCYCDKCNAWSSEEICESAPVSIEKLYLPERIKDIRGIPLNAITIGSESKGRVAISIPSYATPEEAKQVISMYLDLLQYTKDEIDRRGLDIYSSRGKKE